MKILVTGGAGFIGSHACKALARAGHEPVVFDNLSRGHRLAVKWGPFVHGDLSSPEALQEALRLYAIEGVLHFAALAYVGESTREAGRYFSTNVGGTINLLEAMRMTGCHKLILSSSCATYGLPERLPLTESHPQRPVNPYGETKLMAERVIDWYRQLFGLRAMSLRYFNAAGSDPEIETGELHEPEPHLLPLVIEAALDPSRPVTIFGTDYATPDGTAVRDYVHVSDLAFAHVAALQRLEQPDPPGALNLGTGRGASVRDVVDAVREVTGLKPHTIEAPRRLGDPDILVADSTLAAAELGWQPKFSTLPQMIRTAWQWRTSPLRSTWADAQKASGREE